MKCFSFDLATAMQAVGDTERRDITARARAAADAGEDVPTMTTLGDSYWSKAVCEFKQIIVNDTYAKRKARIERMKAR